MTKRQNRRRKAYWDRKGTAAANGTLFRSRATMEAYALTCGLKILWDERRTVPVTQ